MIEGRYLTVEMDTPFSVITGVIIVYRGDLQWFCSIKR